jgi:hypothetical protein
VPVITGFVQRSQHIAHPRPVSGAQLAEHIVRLDLDGRAGQIQFEQ